jgi:hypothetical protein
VEELERRLAALEAGQGRPPGPAVQPVPVARHTAPAPAATRQGDDLEFEVGQSWFALVGIVALVAGLGFMLAQPWPALPAFVPSLGGAGAGGVLLLLAARWRGAFELVARYFWGAGLAVVYFAAVRLFFFGQPPAIAPNSALAPAVLLAVAGGIVGVGYVRQSLWLAGLGLLALAASVAAFGSPWLVWSGVLLVSGLTVFLSGARGWEVLLPFGTVLGSIVYALWMMGNPHLGNPARLTAESGVGPLVLLAQLVIIAGGHLRRREKTEGPLLGLGTVTNCMFGYGLFLVHTVGAYRGTLVGLQLGAFAVLLGLAVAFWWREQSRLATFFYAMTGYFALSLAIVKAVEGPAVFVWLSVQSVVVVATAIWFRSRFIVVANFLIYVMIVLSYVVAVKVETGISLGFGLVALASARILNWQQKRLELKTELMRNAYLVSAFVVFPYALYHLVAGKLVALAWVGLALFYYVANLVVRSPKFRWMGHATLLLTALYLAIAGTSRFGPAYRVLSFLVLGTVLLVVSLIFTRLRKRRETDNATENRPPAP